jgi:glycosyltransferase 2 family protein
VAAVLLGWLIYTLGWKRGFDWAVVGRSIAGIEGKWLLISLIPIFGTYLGRALRWAVFLKPLKPEPSLANLLSATIIGFTAIALFGRPGEFIRPYLIAVKERVPMSSQFAAWILERIFDLLMALLVFAYALSKVNGSGVQVGPNLKWVIAAGGEIVAAACVFLFVLLLSFRHFSKPVQRWLTAALRFLPADHYRRAEQVMGAFVQGMEATRSDAALMAIFLYSVVEWLLIAASYWCLAQACSGMLHFSIVDVLIFMGFVSFGAVIQIPGIGGGVQVVAVVVLTELFGLKLEVATSFAVLVWAITFVAIIPFGLILALREGLNWRSLRLIGREAAP